MRVALAIATSGRPQVLWQTLLRIARQTVKPHALLIVGAAESDVPSGILPAGAKFMIAPQGITRQRNRALDELHGIADVIAFIDDDYFPARDFVEGIARLMLTHADVVAASGHLLADGFRSPGISFSDADALIATYEGAPAKPPVLIGDTGTYGCNMVIRVSALPEARFDENLPLYAWLEDTDFSAQFSRIGRVVRTNYFAGVHLGTKSGKGPGLRLGYSQIANPLYLARKGTLPGQQAARMAIKNIIANALRSAKPEPWIDRAGRLRGNVLAISDIIRGRSHPKRVLDL